MSMKADYTLLLASIALAAGLHAQGTAPRDQPSGYPVRAELPNMNLAAEYLVHSMPTPKGAIFVQDYLVIEVAAYPKGKQSVTLSSGQFTLRINGRTRALLSQTPGMVAASLKYPDWQQRPTATVEAGVGDGSVILGRPPAVGRFPGDPTPNRRQTPMPRAPVPENPAGESAPPDPPIGELCQRLAVPEGAIHGPSSGYLFFPFQGKIKSIRSVQLIYEGPDGAPATLSLL